MIWKQMFSSLNKNKKMEALVLQRVRGKGSVKRKSCFLLAQDLHNKYLTKKEAENGKKANF